MTRSLIRVAVFPIALGALLAAACSSTGSPAGAAPERDPAPAPATATDVGRAPASPADAGGDSTAKHDPPNEKHEPLFVGRFDTTDPAGPRAAWPGARILARFDGSAVSVKFSEFAEPWMEGAPSYWEVRIDKGDWVPIAMIADNQPHVFELAKGLPPGPHQVELFKRSETQTGMTQFLGFDFHGGKSLAPPPRQTRKIEVMGDSQATGFGIEMLNAPNHDCPGADHGGRWQNFRKAWGGRLGERFDAEVHGIVFSGKGVVKNITPADPDTLVKHYARTNPNPALQNSNPQLFDLTSWIPDVIVLTHGSIDFGASVDPSEFRAVYRAFVINQLRARSPSTHIFLSVLGRGAREVITDLANSIVAERAAMGDDRIHAFVANDYTWEEMVACNGHGTPAWHDRITTEIAAEITKKVGWQ